ncbi:hypothetical protein ISS96_03425 [Candidatus Bathyarchaeota archaeon]|nr:hypothetical protein [Candidatus Bathyarchaeota archaeon]
MVIGARSMELPWSIIGNVFYYIVLMIMSLVFFAYLQLKNWIQTQRIIRTFELIAPRDEE